MRQNDSDAIRRDESPDAFDRALDQIKGLPGVIVTRPATIRMMPTLAIGGSNLFVVTTVRSIDQHEESPRSKDTIFLECYGSGGQHRLVLPAAVADAIARQRESLTTKSRSKSAKKLAEDRAARGERPAFLARRKR